MTGAQDTQWSVSMKKPFAAIGLALLAARAAGE
jgi:hypothetical protein